MHPIVNIISVEETGSILKIGLAFSKWPYLPRAYLVTICRLRTRRLLLLTVYFKTTVQISVTITIFLSPVTLPGSFKCNHREGCCIIEKPCRENEGDCEIDSHCFGELLCGKSSGMVNNCNITSTDPQLSCCYDPYKCKWASSISLVSPFTIRYLLGFLRILSLI